MRGRLRLEWVRQVLKAAATGYSRRIIEENKGNAPINRPSTFQHRHREAKKLVSKSTWYKVSSNQASSNLHQPATKHTSNKSKRVNSISINKNKNNPASQANQPEAVIFIPHTPQGNLKKSLQKVQEDFVKGKKFQSIRFVERQGTKVDRLVFNPAT